MSTSTKTRREFLVALGAGAVAVVAAALTGKPQRVHALGASVVVWGERLDYQLTPDVQDYYRTASV